MDLIGQWSWPLQRKMYGSLVSQLLSYSSRGVSMWSRKIKRGSVTNILECIRRVPLWEEQMDHLFLKATTLDQQNISAPSHTPLVAIWLVLPLRWLSCQRMHDIFLTFFHHCMGGPGVVALTFILLYGGYGVVTRMKKKNIYIYIKKTSLDSW